MRTNVFRKTASGGGGTNIQRSVGVSSRAGVNSHGGKQKKGIVISIFQIYFYFFGVENASKKSKNKTPKTILRSL
jgi:hypothetical protein